MTEDSMNEFSTTPDMNDAGAAAGAADDQIPDLDLQETGRATDPVVDTGPQEEQLLYAKILEVGMLMGLLFLLITFTLYLTRTLPAVIPIDQLSDFWTMNVHDFLESLNEHFLHEEHLLTGWAWLSQVWKGDFINFVPIAILSAITIICYIGIVPVLLRKGDRAYVIMALVEVLILTLAASGILAVGH
ncbi:hypothetical protein ACFL6R_07335 [Gemmatimonadota bacterium]